MNKKIVFVFFIIFSSIFFIVYSISTTAAPAPPTPSSDEIDQEQIRTAVHEAIEGQREFVLGYLLNEVQIKDINLTSDESQGIVSLELVDPETGEVLPTEPGLAFAVHNGEEWEVVLPGDQGWIDLLEAAPTELLADQTKLAYTEMYTADIQAATGTYSGYLLPWEAGRTVYLSQSTGHDRYIPSGSAHYSFDFYISKTMFPLRAARAGTVWRTRWDVSNGNDDDMGNYIVLRDESTTPTTYQLYLHLAQDSIPAELKQKGAYVAQGQMIGIADDTGQSTGHHLHFQVHTNPDSYWGTSVDITFDDVDINGGRPRRESDLEYCTRPGDVCNQFRNNYVSANGTPGDSIPPIGELFEPENGSQITTNSLAIEGWAFDGESGVSSTRLLAYYDDEWHEVGDALQGSEFSGTWEICASDVPDGPLSLALKIQDKAGNYSLNLPGLTHVIKNYNCHSELIQCKPSADQIAVYTLKDFQGDCQILNIGGYANLTPQMDSNIESIRVGGNVIAEIFGNTDFNDRAESIHRSESSLDDNQVRGNQIRSLIVSPKTAPLISPQSLLYPLDGEQFHPGDAVPFSWRYSGPGNEFQVQVIGPSNLTIESDWLPAPSWLAHNLQLQPGSYTWKVRTRKCPEPEQTCSSPWSGTAGFEVITSPPATLSSSAPFTDTLESDPANWSATGLWNLVADPERSHSSSHAWYYGLPEGDYDTGSANSGKLTSRPILIPDDDYLLRFWYWYDAEEPGINWDQRWLQISSNGSPFQNILKLQEDVEQHWLQATIDLNQFSGQEIQVRFLFATLDEIENANSAGWLIDDIEITQEVWPACDDGNDSPANAETISFGQTLAREICPAGDIDYFKFEGQAGDHIVLDVDAQSNNPLDNLDLYLFLLDGDGRSVLTQHDDEILGTLLDPHLGYQLKRNGTYYVRAKLWSHPTHGGEAFDYQITLSKDNSPPQGSFANPLSQTYVNDSVSFDVNLSAEDDGSGISHVQFLYHSGDWLGTDWQEIGVDYDSSNGWGITLDTAEFPEQKGAAFFANIYDWGGNWRGSEVWEIGFDRTPPVTSLQTLVPDQASTAVRLVWSGLDNLSGMDTYQLQSKPSAGEWLNINPSPPGSQTSFWFIGQPGTNYGFRMRGIDAAGNLETFPQIAETSTSIPNPSILCSKPDSWDKSGNDNSPDNSTPIDLEALPAVHNFCNPTTENRLDDEDWVNFEVETGQAYLIESLPAASMTGTIVELYASDGTTLITSAESPALNEKVRMVWTADRTDKVFLRVRHLDGRIAGNVVSYQLRVNRYLPNFFPFIHR